jgi:primase-polymerase (primpol)-like protein
MHAVNGEKFSRLWAGDTSEYATLGNEGRSEADLALCSLLAFWCGPDEGRIDNLFRQSGLYRQKWERADYRALTLAVAMNRDEFWCREQPTARIYTRRERVVSVG